MSHKLVQEYINVLDNSIVWFSIPKFNGYEVSSNGYIRSLKIKKYPFGIIISPNKDGMYELSDNDNYRVKISYQEIFDLVVSNKVIPHSTLDCNNGYKPVRNSRVFINQSRMNDNRKNNIVKKSVKVQLPENQEMTEYHFNIDYTQE